MKTQKVIFIWLTVLLLTLSLQNKFAIGQPIAQVVPFGGSPDEIIGPTEIRPEIIPHKVWIPVVEQEIPIGYLVDIEKLRDIKRQIEKAQPSPENFLPALPGSANPKGQELPQPLVTTRSFPGISYTQYYPPDPTIGAGPYNIVLAVNSSLAIYNKIGGKQLETTFSQWFSDVGTSGMMMFDPWLIYDPFSTRFFLLVAGKDNSTSQSWLYVSVSRQSDAYGPWCNYKFNATLVNGIPTNNWADYPKLGVDDHFVYITANMFDFGGGFQYAKLYIFPKVIFTDCAHGSGWLFYNLANLDGTLAFTVQPTIIQGTPPPGGGYYLINAHVPLTSYPMGSSMTLWKVTCPSCNPPYLNNINLGTLPYNGPPDAQQPGTATKIDTLDGRLLNAAYSGNTIWATQTALSTNYSGVSAVRIYRIWDVDNFNFSWTYYYFAPVEVEYTDSGYYCFNSSIMPDAFGRVTVVFNGSSASEYAGIRYGQRIGGIWRPGVLLRNGETISTVYRWGDYAGSSLDPDGITTWIYNEYTKIGSVWGTWVGAVQ